MNKIMNVMLAMIVGLVLSACTVGVPDVRGDDNGKSYGAGASSGSSGGSNGGGSSGGSSGGVTVGGRTACGPGNSQGGGSCSGIADGTNPSGKFFRDDEGGGPTPGGQNPDNPGFGGNNNPNNRPG